MGGEQRQAGVGEWYSERFDNRLRDGFWLWGGLQKGLGL